jgi:hypothetical protein
MMVALLLYCYATGTRSSRRIMKRCQVDVACRVIVSEDIPDFRTISDFRKIHLTRLETLFVEVLKLCALAGLAKVGTYLSSGLSGAQSFRLLHCAESTSLQIVESESTGRAGGTRKAP